MAAAATYLRASQLELPWASCTASIGKAVSHEHTLPVLGLQYLLKAGRKAALGCTALPSHPCPALPANRRLDIFNLHLCPDGM